MFQQQVYLINMVLMVVDALCVVLAGYLAHMLRSWQSFWLWYIDEYALSISIVFIMFLNNFIMGKIGLYTDRKIHSYWLLGIGIIKAVVIDFAALAASIFILHIPEYSRAFLLYFGVLLFLLLFICRVSATVYINDIARNGFNARRILIVGDQKRGAMVVNALENQLSLGHLVVGHLAVEGNENDCLERLAILPVVLREKEIDEVIFAVPRDRIIDLPAHLNVCSRMGIPARVLPAMWDAGNSYIGVDQCQGIPFLTHLVNRFNPAGLLYKRLLDIAGSLAGIVLLTVMYPFVAFAIKIDSPGPILFRQNRIGRNGRLFMLYKFRSMYVDAEQRKRDLMKANEISGPMFKMKNDPRITRVGRFLRKTSLDEFPQFINVLKGEMSLVGTRPPTPDEVTQYELCHYKRISAKPGITGMWQVSGRSKINDFMEVVKLDCQYLERWRFVDDLKILAKTCWIVLAGKGAS